MTHSKTEPNRIIFSFLILDRGSLDSKCQKDGLAVKHLNYPNNIIGSTGNETSIQTVKIEFYSRCFVN